MNQIKLNQERTGRVSIGIKTPIIRTGDDLKEIVIDSCLSAVGTFQDKSVIGITEAVVAIAQGNYVTPADIQADIAMKYPDQKELTVLFPIQSRNRFMNIMQAIADMPQFERIYVVLSYPCDEVGNRLVSDKDIFYSDINPYTDEFSANEFYGLFGRPKHEFTGKNYIQEFENTNPAKVMVRLCNDLGVISRYCKNVLVCTIREEQRKLHKEILKDYGVERVFDLSEILSKSINGSGYSPKYGLYGSNKMADGRLKLMPRDCQSFVIFIQKEIMERYNRHVEVMVYGDGAFKDPVGGIWELADPVTTLGATSGLLGTPKEVKLKYIASKYGPEKTQQELEEIISQERAERIKTDDRTSEASLGTTPRQITDLLASLMDLTTGSGDEQTPVVYVTGYLK
jgi:F420-0:gamma-glutamyl ligase